MLPAACEVVALVRMRFGRQRRGLPHLRRASGKGSTNCSKSTESCRLAPVRHHPLQFFSTLINFFALTQRSPARRIREQPKNPRALVPAAAWH